MVFTLLIPGVIKLILLFYKSALLVTCEKVSFWFGIIIVVFLCGLLAIEFHQDKNINLHYEIQKNVKLPIRNGLYECQSCGNRTVKSENKSCNVCGVLFKDKDEENEKNR